MPDDLETSEYPRMLVVAIGRINAADTVNNGLLLRNLFGQWPRENLAQIYSSGDNGDEGFCGRYYRLSPVDRRFGKLFYRLKAEAQKEAAEANPAVAASAGGSTRRFAFVRNWATRWLIDGGGYELLFRPRLSSSMLDWVKGFEPHIVFAQGYNLAFTWLPLLLAERLGLPLAYYPTDDWPQNRYRADAVGLPPIARFARQAVLRASGQLVERATVRLAFNPYMCAEYLRRYQKEFALLMHGDEFGRFEAIPPTRLAKPDECWIVATGDFDRHRLPLLEDLDAACEILHRKGFKIRATVFPARRLVESNSHGSGLRHVRFEACPSHAGLASVLRGADILFLPERFDETVKTICLSVSSKAHLFMFSGRPIVVYSDGRAGVARYAWEEGWGALVDHRGADHLAGALERIITDNSERLRLAAAARRVAEANHNLPRIQSAFRDALCTAVHQAGAAP